MCKSFPILQFKTMLRSERSFLDLLFTSTTGLILRRKLTLLENRPKNSNLRTDNNNTRDQQKRLNFTYYNRNFCTTGKSESNIYQPKYH